MPAVTFWPRAQWLKESGCKRAFGAALAETYLLASVPCLSFSSLPSLASAIEEAMLAGWPPPIAQYNLHTKRLSEQTIAHNRLNDGTFALNVSVVSDRLLLVRI